MSEFRSTLRPEDAARVRAVTSSTGFFSSEEVDIAESLVREALDQGDASGYFFVLLEEADTLLGYACFGPIPATVSSYDLYWVVVAAGDQRRGLGRELLSEVERLAAERGAARLFADTAGREQYAPTRAFYESAGYDKAAFLEDFYADGDGKVIFAKRL